MKKHLSLIFLLLSFSVSGQKKNEAFQYHIHRTQIPMKMNGILDETAWQTADLASDFKMVQPIDTAPAVARTEVKMLYDDKNIYLSAICYKKVPGTSVVESLRRDFTFNKNDNFLLFLDTFDDQTNGFTFGANAAGGQWDGLLSEGGSANLSWDNKWESAVSEDDEKWIFEMAVPFKTIRYKKGILRWGINFSRLDLKGSEKSAWAGVPRQFPTASLAYTGVLVWDEPPPAAGKNISLIPYGLSGLSQNYENQTPDKTRWDAGLDAKVAVTSSLNLDLTVNPDFSQVDVDRQQTNLDRFELFFPERRQFFLENGDLFANFGYDRIRPFFSRRIGLNAPIRFGARFSGKLDKNWRIGVLNMQTGKNTADIPPQNFGIFALQRRVFARSYISALFVNKETFDYETVTDTNNIKRFNRNLGFEYNLASLNNIWTGKMLYLRSFSTNQNADNQTLAANLLHAATNWTYGLKYEYVGVNYRAEVGYIPRVGYHAVYPQLGYLYFPKKKGAVLSHGPLLGTSIFFNKKFGQIEDEEILQYRINFYNRSDFSFFGLRNYVELQNKFDPTNFTKDTLATGTKHTWYTIGADYNSQPQSLLTYSLSTRYGGYYASGKRFRFDAAIGYRFQPFVAITMNVNYNRLDFFEEKILPENLKNKRLDFWLVGPRIDITFTNKLYFTNFLQYNNQSRNVNLNMRLQWRYRPASDLFIVYTDNYVSNTFAVRNRAVVLKLTYWWNV